MQPQRRRSSCPNKAFRLPRGCSARLSSSPTGAAERRGSWASGTAVATTRVAASALLLIAAGAVLLTAVLPTAAGEAASFSLDPGTTPLAFLGASSSLFAAGNAARRRAQADDGGGDDGGGDDGGGDDGGGDDGGGDDGGGDDGGGDDGGGDDGGGDDGGGGDDNGDDAGPTPSTSVLSPIRSPVLPPLPSPVLQAPVLRTPAFTPVQAVPSKPSEGGSPFKDETRAPVTAPPTISMSPTITPQPSPSPTDPPPSPTATDATEAPVSFVEEDTSTPTLKPVAPSPYPTMIVYTDSPTEPSNVVKLSVSPTVPAPVAPTDPAPVPTASSSTSAPVPNPLPTGTPAPVSAPPAPTTPPPFAFLPAPTTPPAPPRPRPTAVPLSTRDPSPKPSSRPTTADTHRPPSVAPADAVPVPPPTLDPTFSPTTLEPTNSPTDPFPLSPALQPVGENGGGGDTPSPTAAPAAVPEPAPNDDGGNTGADDETSRPTRRPVRSPTRRPSSSSGSGREPTSESEAGAEVPTGAPSVDFGEGGEANQPSTAVPTRAGENSATTPVSQPTIDLGYSYDMVRLARDGLQMSIQLSKPLSPQGQQRRARLLGPLERRAQATAPVDDAPVCIDVWQKYVKDIVRYEMYQVLPKVELAQVELQNVALGRLLDATDASTLLFSFGAQIRVRSAATEYDVDRYLSAPFDTDKEKQTFVDYLRSSECPAFRDATSIQLILPPSTTVESPNSGSAAANTGLIVGIVAAALALAMLVALLAYVRYKGRRGAASYRVRDEHELLAGRAHDHDDRTTNDYASEIGLRTSGDVSTLSDPIPPGGPAAASAAGPPGDASTAGSFTLDYDFQKAYQASASVSDASAAGGGGGSSVASNPFFSTDDDTLEAQYVSDEQVEVLAPAGVLGLVLETNEDGIPVVNNVKGSSVLAGQVMVGDRLLSVDGQDVTVMLASDVSKLIAVKKHKPERRLVFARPIARGRGHLGPESSPYSPVTDHTSQPVWIHLQAAPATAAVPS